MPATFPARRLLLAAALFGGTTGAALANPTNGELLSNFNVITGTYNTSSESEGPVIVGGNFNGNSFNVGTNGAPTAVTAPSLTSTGGYGALNIYGNATGSANLNGRVADVTGTYTGNYGNTVNASYTFSYTYSSLFSQISQLSAALALVATSNGTSFVSDSNGGYINAAPTTIKGVNNAAVINITGAQLNNLDTNVNGTGFSLNGTQILVVNVNTTGGTINKNFNMTGIAPNVLLNFYDATGTVTFGGEIGGTILDPNGTISASTAIDGTVAANTLSTSGEVHWHPLASAGQALVTAFGSGGVNNVAVPEPSSLGLLGAGLLGLASIRRLRRRA